MSRFPLRAYARMAVLIAIALLIFIPSRFTSTTFLLAWMAAVMIFSYIGSGGRAPWNIKLRDWGLYVLISLAIVGIVAAIAIHDVRSNPPAQNVKHSPPPQGTKIDEDDIREAVFRYQFQHNAAAQKNPGVFCLSIGEHDRDPSEEFMKRFAAHVPAVRKISSCRERPDSRVEDSTSGMVGLILRVTTITWISPGQARVDGGYYEGNLSSSGNVYTVMKHNGKWEVVKGATAWIS